jgi:hypothetical protein
MVENLNKLIEQEGEVLTVFKNCIECYEVGLYTKVRFYSNSLKLLGISKDEISQYKFFNWYNGVKHDTK